ncbi:MAG: TerB family tellurite resistance protein [Rhizobiaceae bacterium]
MSIWFDISRYLSTIAADALSSVMEGLRTVFADNREKRRRVAFSVALIALSAKMAKADGVVTQDEVDAFRDVFKVPPEELGNVSRLYNLAKQDVAGFDSYCRQVKSLFPGDDPSDGDVLQDVLEALFHIAKADGLVHENEGYFLDEVAYLFGFEERAYQRIKMRHMHPANSNPYFVLDADPQWDFAQLKSHYRKRVAESHPDRLIARGVPSEFVVIATDRLAALNAAWEAIEAIHSPRAPVGVS